MRVYDEFVAMDENRKPTPVPMWEPTTDEEKRIKEAAISRFDLRRDVQLNTLVSDVATLRRREASQKNIEIRENLAPGLPIILSEPALLRQLLINLINNAMDAMPEGGSITIGTRQGDNGGVCIQVEDTGFGIPEENMDKIFDPFFTTKAPGKGAGLGLSISHGILVAIESIAGQAHHLAGLRYIT